jgi:hypothetical protein
MALGGTLTFIYGLVARIHLRREYPVVGEVSTLEVADVKRTVARLRATFNSGTTRSVAWRIHQVCTVVWNTVSPPVLVIPGGWAGVFI